MKRILLFCTGLIVCLTSCAQTGKPGGANHTRPTTIDIREQDSLRAVYNRNRKNSGAQENARPEKSELRLPADSQMTRLKRSHARSLKTLEQYNERPRSMKTAPATVSTMRASERNAQDMKKIQSMPAQKAEQAPTEMLSQ